MTSTFNTSMSAQCALHVRRCALQGIAMQHQAVRSARQYEQKRLPGARLDTGSHTCVQPVLPSLLLRLLRLPLVRGRVAMQLRSVLWRRRRVAV